MAPLFLMNCKDYQKKGIGKRLRDFTITIAEAKVVIGVTNLNISV